jgi:hypothetical protein
MMLSAVQFYLVCVVLSGGAGDAVRNTEQEKPREEF